MTKPMEERLEDRQARRDGGSGETGGEMMTVPVNVYEADGAVVVVAPLPGVMAGDVTLEVEPGRLTIRAAMRSAAPKDYLLHEWHYGPFERTLDIPAGFGAEVKTSFGNGQLAVSLCRGEPTGTKTITVS
jgi:HSP20 family protein